MDTSNPSGLGGMSLDQAASIADERDREREQAQGDDYEHDDNEHVEEHDDHEGSQHDDQAADDGDDEVEEVEYEGKKYNLPKSVKNALLRQSDYTQKTQSLAEQRKAFETHAQAVAQERQYYANHVAQITQSLAQNIQQLPTEQQIVELAKTDPARAVQLQAERNLKISQFSQAQQIQQQIHQQQQAEEQRQLSETLQRERDSLLTKLPAWKNEKVAAKERAAIVNFLNDAGFSNDDLAGLTDHRSILVARDAMLYRQMMKGNGKQAPQQQPQGKPAPRVMQPGNQRSGADPKAPKEMVQKFKDTRSMKDALAILNRIT